MAKKDNMRMLCW